MSTRAMVSVMFIVCILGLIFGVGYGAYTRDAGPVVAAIVFGGTGALVMAALSQEIE